MALLSSPSLVRAGAPNLAEGGPVSPVPQCDQILRMIDQALNDPAAGTGLAREDGRRVPSSDDDRSEG
jgi:hypothetical protein